MKTCMYKIIIIAPFLNSTCVMILLNGCVAYYPKGVDIPLIKEKGDVRIDGGFFVAQGSGTSELETVLGVQSTFSAGITKMIAIQGYVNFDLLGNGYLQGATGLFKKLGDKTVIELYGGYGLGGAENKGNDYHPFAYDYKYQLAFAQFNFGRTDVGGAKIDYGLGLKSGYLYTKHIFPAATVYENGGILEPSVFFRIGSRKVKFCARVNYLWTDVIVEYYYFPVSVSLGVNINL